jgi:hypothetical protein
MVEIAAVRHGRCGYLVNLDADPGVMRFVAGGMLTSHEEIKDEFLPGFLGYYRRYRDCGFWAAIDRQPGNSWDSFISGRVTVPLPARPNSVTGCARQPGAKGTPLRGRALIGKGFTQYGVQRVVAEAMAVNQASRRVTGKAALTLVRTFLQPWPYPVDGDQSASWSMRWTRPDGSSRTSPAVAQPDRRAPGEAQVRDGAYAGQLACAGAGLAGSVTSPSARPPRVSRQARELACLSRVGPRGDGR